MNSSYPTPLLNGTLNAGQQLKVKFSAPAGQQINILSKPASANSILVSALLWSDSSLGSPSVDTPGTSYAFTGFAGAAPSQSGFGFLAGSGEKFLAYLELDSGGFSFQSLEMLFDIPAGYDRTFTNYTPSSFSLGVQVDWVGYGYSEDAYDPGPMASISRAAQPVPEPSTAVFCCIAIVLGAAARRFSRRTSRA